ncbi:MAG: hypothetical protein WEC99_04965 [Halofilum sp. (in: g-proteobacteria)]
MKKSIATLAAAGLAFAVSGTASASDRVVGASSHTDREAANAALDRAEENAPDAADHGLSTAREAVNNNGVGHGSRATGARNSNSRGGGDGGAGSRGGRGGSGGGPGR